MNVKNLLETIVKILDEHKAIDIVTLDVSNLTDIASHMIICSGTSTRHIKSLSDSLVVESKALGFKPIGVSGEDTCEWILVDLGDVIIHLMLPETRAFYSLEKLWDIGQIKLKQAAKAKAKAEAKAVPKEKAKTKVKDKKSITGKSKRPIKALATKTKRSTKTTATKKTPRRTKD
jgi:ribosome-associated protein